MNTAIDFSTHSSISSRDIRAAWRLHARDRNSTASQHATLGLLLGKDLDAMFSPITRPSKLNNGAQPCQGRDAAVSVALSGNLETWTPWKELLQGATIKEKWGRKYYDMGSHPLLIQAAARWKR